MGVVLGVSAGISPGPLIALVIGETLRHGRRAGIQVALSPLLTDLPAVALAAMAVYGLADLGPALCVLSVVGGLFVVHLGVDSLRRPDISAVPQKEAPSSLKKAVVANLLSPHPYLFWTGVGMPAVHRAFGEGGVAAPAAFVIGFYLLLVGTKCAVAVIIDRFGAVVVGRRLRRVNQSSLKNRKGPGKIDIFSL